MLLRFVLIIIIIIIITIIIIILEGSIKYSIMIFNEHKGYKWDSNPRL